MVGPTGHRYPGVSGLRIVTFATERFSSFLRMWASFPGVASALDDVELVAGDSEAERTAREVGISNTSRFDGGLAEVGRHTRRLRPFWARRFEEIVDRAVEDDMLHSDLDAFWLSDVRGEIENLDFDLAFSIAHGTPPDAVDTWGFTLCCGLFATRAHPSTNLFMGEWSDWVDRMKHDQDAVNALLLSKGVSWSAGPQGFLTTETSIDNRPVKIAAVPERLVRRAPPFSVPDTRIAHPFFEREFFSSFTTLYEALYIPSGVEHLDIESITAKQRHLSDRLGVSSGDDLWNLAALMTLIERDPGLDECAIHAGILYERLGAGSEAAELLGSRPSNLLATFPSAAVALQRLSDRGLVSAERASEVSRSSSGNPRALLRVGLGLARRGQLISASLPISRALVSAGREHIGMVFRGLARRLS